MPSLLSEAIGTLRRALEAGHGVPKFGALEGLKEKFVGAHAQRLNHRLAVGVVVRRDHVEIGRGLLEAFERFEALLGVAGEVDDNAAVRIALQILQDTHIEVRGDFLVFRHDLCARNVQQVVANHLTKVFVG